ncbi:MAG: hypothetical protein IJ421_08760 [Prevotella sp.]|nr:hypothetical protein [Prevotella sp.]
MIFIVPIVTIVSISHINIFAIPMPWHRRLILLMLRLLCPGVAIAFLSCHDCYAMVLRWRSYRGMITMPSWCDGIVTPPRRQSHRSALTKRCRGDGIAMAQS